MLSNHRYHVERGNIDESRTYFESCQKICEIEPDSTQITCGDNEGCMAQIANLQNDYQAAISHALKSIKIFEEHDKYGWRLPQAYNELSEAYIATGRWAEAAEQADMAIKGYFALPEDDYPDWAMMNKAFSLCNLGSLDEASAVLEEYLAYREKTFGPMDSESFK
jgi:tetratricopeptide (TPR) repeat protein